jgi:hypothetical protein
MIDSRPYDGAGSSATFKRRECNQTFGHSFKRNLRAGGSLYSFISSCESCENRDENSMKTIRLVDMAIERMVEKQ